MHIKRFVARDMKHAIRLVRDEQGPDAVILSNQQVPGGIEIIAAVDYDPRLIDHALGANPEQAKAASTVANGAAAPPAERADDSATPARRSDGKSLRLPSPARRTASTQTSQDSASEDTAKAEETTAASPARREASDGSRTAARRTRRTSSTTRKTANSAGSSGKRQSTTSEGTRRASKRTASASAATPARAAAKKKRRAAPRAAPRPAPALEDTKILLPSDPPPADAPTAAVRHGGRDGVGQAFDDGYGPRPVSMTLWREGPQASVELSLLDEDNEPPSDTVDWEPPGERSRVGVSAFDGRNDMVELDELPTQTPESFGEAMTAQQLAYPRSTGDAARAPLPSARRPTITRQRYAEIEEYPDPTPEAEATGDEADLDALREDQVELSNSLPSSPGAKGNGLLSVLAGVGRRSERARGGGGEQRSGATQMDRQQTVRLYLRSLHRVGMSDPLVQELASAAAANNETVDWPALAGQATARLRTLDQEVIDRGGVVALVGPTGVGKTTSIAKLAARFALKHGRERLALITTDTFRVGAHEQLNTFARILGVPLFQADDPKTFSALMRRLARHRLVLIDTAGMGQRDLRLAEELSLLSRSRANVQVLLTLCANTERRTMLDTIERFADAKPAGCVLTKMDEARAPGTALGALIETGLPLAYTSNGQNVPEDLHWARSKRLSLVSHVFHQADMESRDQIDDTDEVRESA
ncbi:MAG: AAA family ATPase [Pseudomonadota bacterium]